MMTEMGRDEPESDRAVLNLPVRSWVGVTMAKDIKRVIAAMKRKRMSMTKLCNVYHLS